MIEATPTHKNLGVTFDQELRWTTQVANMVKTGTEWAMKFKRLGKMRGGLSPKLMSMLYKTVLIPKIFYGTDVWYSPPESRTGAQRQTGSVGALRKFTTVQRMCTIAITGAYRTTPTELLDLHANTLPVDIQLRKQHRRTAARYAALPASHATTSRLP